MHPFGGTQFCPRCEKAVYAAEQVMGPGRQLYHKPCLACTTCNKRLDSYTLLEHQQKPYCKSCHTKNFGVRDLRQANLTPSPAPLHRSTYKDSSSSGSPPRAEHNNAEVESTRTTPLPSLFITGVSAVGTVTQFPCPAELDRTQAVSDKEQLAGNFQECDDDDEAFSTRGGNGGVGRDPSPLATSQNPSANPISTATPSNTGRPGLGGIPRTVPLTPTRNATYGVSSITKRPFVNQSARPTTQDAEPSPLFDNSAVHHLPNNNMKPIMQTATGTRYGAALAGGSLPAQLTGSTGSPKKWGAGGSNPGCPRCGKTVYFAEQVRAVGKIYHKNCLRCTECNTLLDSNRLRDHGGKPLCVRCYSKLHGPQGGGYALLGKAGG